jgi:two-component system CheB/CheR fusion protein
VAGRLDVTWHLQEERLLVLCWRESGLTTPPDSSRRGFGRHLIERALAYSMQASTALVFGPDGVTCRIEIPLGPEG